MAHVRVFYEQLSGLDRTKEMARYVAERIAQHEKETYDNLDMFFKLSTVIVGALGYLALQNRRSTEFWIIQKLAWSLWYIEWIVVLAFGVSILLVYMALWRQWNTQFDLGVKRTKPVGWHVARHVQPYWIAGMLLVPVLLWCFLMNSFFR